MPKHNAQAQIDRREYRGGPAASNGITWYTGFGVPSAGTAGYAPNCIYHRLDGGTNTTLYRNSGSNTSSTWAAFTVA
jgi:hypothetical protein